MSEVKYPVWTRDQGIEYIRKYEYDAFMVYGYTLSLGGSLLYKGYSYKDLDIVAIPAASHPHMDNTTYETYIKFIEWINTFAGTSTGSNSIWNPITRKHQFRIDDGRIVDWFVVFNPEAKERYDQERSGSIVDADSV